MGRRAKGIHHYMESKVIMGVGGWRARSVSGGGQHGDHVRRDWMYVDYA